RLEKGLAMRPRKSAWGLDYIAGMCRCYEQIVIDPAARARYDPQELKWVGDVLTDYFAAAGFDPKIDPLRKRFRALPPIADECEAQSPKFVPYKRDLSAPPSVGYDDLLKLARRRRSVRWFLPRPVPRQAIEQAIALAAQSPSACNRQPFVFRVFD